MNVNTNERKLFDTEAVIKILCYHSSKTTLILGFILRFYIVGSNSTETSFHVLKIDRTEPRDLAIHDDKVEYDKTQIRNILTMIKHGNITKDTKKTDSTSLIKSVSAFGIIGFVRFLEGYYIILITKRRKVAVIGTHIIYKIEDTSMIYIPNDSVRYTHPDESNYSYDLTHTLQYHMAPSSISTQSTLNEDKTYGVKFRPASKYVWNKFLLKLYEKLVIQDWVINIIHGFIDQKNICVFGKPVFLTLIARRSNKFAGTRFLKRGANCHGYVANEVETEQIVHDASLTFLDKTKLTSFVQTRGSIPLHWSQDVSKMVPKPTILLDKRDPYASSAGQHFNQMLKRHGAPVIIFNLIKRREKKKHESILTAEYKEAVIYLNQFLPSVHAIRYIGFDMAHVSKNKNKNVLDKLDKIAQHCVKQTGFYFKNNKVTSEEFWQADELKGIQGHKTPYGSRQTGVVRTNCVDCLDRTNTAQFSIGKCALGYQLYVLGVIESPNLQFESDCIRMLEQLYEAQGDTIALQYGGSQLVHRIEGYRKLSPWTSQSKEIMHTFSRYYSNTFSDLEKQQVINIFLGVFEPVEESKPRDSLLIPTKVDSSKIGHFDDFYKTFEFTPLHERFAITLMHSARDIKPKGAKDESPFTPRIQISPKEPGHEPNPNISGKDSTASTGSDALSESSTDSIDMEGKLNESDSPVSPEISLGDFEMQEDDLSFTFDAGKKSSYGVELRQPSKRDTRIYERYPTSVFKLGSIHGVEPPPVNRQDQDIYNNYIMCGLYGPKTVSKVDLHCYNSHHCYDSSISHKYFSRYDIFSTSKSEQMDGELVSKHFDGLYMGFEKVKDVIIVFPYKFQAGISFRKKYDFKLSKKKYSNTLKNEMEDWEVIGHIMSQSFEEGADNKAISEKKKEEILQREINELESNEKKLLENKDDRKKLIQVSESENITKESEKVILTDKKDITETPREEKLDENLNKQASIEKDKNSTKGT
ncbi:hypothetical protein KUTeg_008006, partial [Tegillarca granosa]